MSELHDNNLTDWHSELNLFQGNVYQTSIESETDLDYMPLTTIGNGGPIEFYVRGIPGKYRDLNNSKIEIKAKITKADGAVLAGGDKNLVAASNNLLHTLFQTVELEVNGKLVTDPNTSYPYRAYIEALVNTPKNLFDTRMKCQGWEKDTAGKFDITDATAANLGLKARELWMAENGVFEMMGRPHMDLFHQEKLIPPHCDLKFRFIPQKSEFVLIAKDAGAQNANYKIVITSARLFIRTKSASPSLLLAHEKLLNEGPCRIPFNKVTSKVINIPQGMNNYESDNLYMGTLPDKIIMALIPNENMSGSYKTNPFDFQHAKLNYLTMKVNGEMIPTTPLQPDFVGKDYIKEYYKVLEALNYDIGTSCWDITPEEWAAGFNIWAFKITPGPLGAVRSIPRVGNIRIEMKFAAATDKIYNILLLSSRAAELQVDKFKNVNVIEP